MYQLKKSLEILGLVTVRGGVGQDSPSCARSTGANSGCESSTLDRACRFSVCLKRANISMYSMNLVMGLHSTASR